MHSATMLQTLALLSVTLFHYASAVPAIKHPTTNTTTSPFQLRIHTKPPGGTFDGDLLVATFFEENEYYNFDYYNFTPATTSSQTLNLVNGLFEFSYSNETIIAGLPLGVAAPVLLETQSVGNITGAYYIDQHNQRLGVTSSSGYSFTNAKGKTVTYKPKGTDHWAICDHGLGPDEGVGLYFGVFEPHLDYPVVNCTAIIIKAEEVSLPYVKAVGLGT